MAIPEPDPKEGKDIVFKAFMKDVEDRAEFGIMKYRTYLKTFNGRNALEDAYQEAIDLCLYLKQCLMENEALSKEAGRIVFVADGEIVKNEGVDNER